MPNLCIGTSGTPLQYVIVDRLGAFFTEPNWGLFDNNVPFDNTTPIYLINLLWKLWSGLGLDLELHYFSIFTENNDNEHLSSSNFTRTQTINNKIKLHILGVAMTKLGN